ncbi:MAG TPA: TRAP transporter large permease [Firmicutes bacterium]|jgi:tripartite ATP-independent transporter DctM subunit|nr:TRAP transporter large permease [Bacillota bacterium]
MTPGLIGLIGIVLLLILLAIRMPVGIAMLIVGFLGIAYLLGVKCGLARLGMTPFAQASNYGLSAVPLFTLMGMLLLQTEFGRDLYDVANTWIGHLRGGLAMATIGACAAFGAVCGSVNATTATMASVSIPEMNRFNYKPILSTACVAAGGTLGILIPPSVILILYGILTMEPIGKLLIAGIFPGILQAILFAVMIYLQVRRDPSLCDIQPKKSTREKIVVLKNIWVVVVLFLLSIGGIYLGVFTPTEAAGVGAFGAFAISLLSRRLTFKRLWEALDSSVQITTMIFLVVIGATVFGYFLAAARIPMMLSSAFASMAVSRYLILAGILFMYFILGLFMEGIAILVLTVPIIYPVIIDLGFNGIWFGIIMTILINIGLITPPVGIGVYITSSVSKVSVETVFRGIAPFLAAMIVCLLLIVIFPQIALILPNLMR